jgi:hypothetical protein
MYCGENSILIGTVSILTLLLNNPSNEEGGGGDINPALCNFLIATNS